MWRNVERLKAVFLSYEFNWKLSIINKYLFKTITKINFSDDKLQSRFAIGDHEGHLKLRETV